MAEKTLEDLCHETLKDIYYAERKIATALRKMARAAQSPDLKAAFEAHEEETQTQIERLTQVFDIIGKRPRGKTCVSPVSAHGTGLRCKCWINFPQECWRKIPHLAGSAISRAGDGRLRFVAAAHDALAEAVG